MCKNIIIGAGIAVASYKLGKGVGYLKCFKSMINTTDEIFPGLKDGVIEHAASAITKSVFKTNNTTKRNESC